VENFTPIYSLVGGAIIGIAAVWLLLFNGRIAGITGIISGLFNTKLSGKGWRLFFILGLVGGTFLAVYLGAPMPVVSDKSNLILCVAGLIVGLGTSIGSGCTSGHGVCGISRFSKRSIVATCVFMASAMITVFVVGV